MQTPVKARGLATPSFRGRLLGVVRLVHPFPTAVVVVTSMVLYVVALKGVPPVDALVRAGLVVLLSQVGIGSLNDYLDRFTDARTQPDKPIPAGLVSPTFALLLALVSLLLIVPASLTFGPISLLIFGIATGGGLAYDLWLKPTPASILAYVVAFLALGTWIWFVSGKLNAQFFVVYPAGALLVVGAHLANAFPDIETDLDLGHRNIAALLGPRRTLLCMTAFPVVVATGTFAFSLIRGSVAGAGLAALGVALGAASFSIGQRGLNCRKVRKVSFRLTALAVGVVIIGALSTL